MEKRIYRMYGYKKLRLLFGLAFIPLLVLFLMLRFSVTRLLREAEYQNQNNSCIEHLHIIRFEISESDQAIGNYFMQKDSLCLKPYYAAKPVIDSVFQLVQDEVENFSWRQESDTLRLLIETHFKLFSQKLILFGESQNVITDSTGLITANADQVYRQIKERIEKICQLEKLFLGYKKEISSKELNFFHRIILTLFIYTLLCLIAMWIIYRKENKARQKADYRMHDFQKTYLSTMFELREQTLQNISQDIHDNIGQVLSLAKLNLASVDGSGSVALQDKVRDAKELVAKAIKDLRNLSHSINSDHVTQLGLSGVIQFELDMVAKSGLFKTFFSTEGTECKLSTHKELVVFRIFQEVINNIIKHADAAEITVSIVFNSSNLSLIISDNGRGFNTVSKSKSSDRHFSLGISSMQKRASVVNATFYITSFPGRGTVVTIGVPFELD